MTVLNLSTYLPQECGIATFSMDLRKSLLPQGHKFEIIAISDKEDGYSYPKEVVCKMYKHNRNDYVRAAEFANTRSDVELIVIQHEYGIFGGPDGNYVLDFAQHLSKPFIIITHSVLPKPSEQQQYILHRLCQMAAGIVCMTNSSANLLHTLYNAHSELITIIPHGVPLFKQHHQEDLKRKYGCEGRQIITTFGLIGPGKGLETGIKALAEVAALHPSALYLILGKTHPNLIKSEGESYRNMLRELTSSLNLDNNVKFVNKFLTDDELGEYLHMTDIYLSPYPNRDQAVSGTMAFALGCGLAIVSTAYAYAQEVLAEGRGLLAQTNEPHEMAALLKQILEDRKLQNALQGKALTLGETLVWPAVGKKYSDFFAKILNSYKKNS